MLYIESALKSEKEEKKVELLSIIIDNSALIARSRMSMYLNIANHSYCQDFAKNKYEDC